MFNPLPRQAVTVRNSFNPADCLAFWQAEFEAYMTGELGLSSATTRGRRWIIKRFLTTVATGDSPVVLTLKEVDAFLQSLGEQGGYSRVSLRSVAGGLRSFCRYAATRGWCESGVADAIRTPRVYSLDSVPMGPSWEDVKRLLALTEGDKPTDIRARAILMLLATYGLRAGEVRHLRLDDLDWERELLSVSCSKTLRKRIFPLSRPVGDAVLLYIKRVRPHTLHREVFLTLDGRPLGNGDIYVIVNWRLRRLEAPITHHGPHALRHACATHLLAEGLSLKQIGDQLGHLDPDSTRIYAKVDITGLRKVADMDLEGLL
jgi:site-specific recombinase XerD